MMSTVRVDRRRITYCRSSRHTESGRESDWGFLEERKPEEEKRGEGSLYFTTKTKGQPQFHAITDQVKRIWFQPIAV
jgi:hypothetical protein